MSFEQWQKENMIGGAVAGAVLPEATGFEAWQEQNKKLEPTLTEKIQELTPEERQRLVVTEAGEVGVAGVPGPGEIVSTRILGRPEMKPQVLRPEPPKEYENFMDEISDALARGITRTGAGGMGFMENIAQASIFQPGFFQEKADFLREISEMADIQPAQFAEDAPNKEKVRAFIANAVGETLPYTAAALASTVATGSPAAAFATTFAIEGENERQQALSEGATEEEANNRAFVVGTINGAIEKLQVDEIIRFSGTGKASKKAIIDAIKQRSLKKIAKEGGKLSLAAAKSAVSEGIQETLQEATTILSPALGGQPIPEEGKAQRLAGAFLGGAVTGPILGGVTAGISPETQVTQDEEGRYIGEYASPEEARQVAERIAEELSKQDLDFKVESKGNQVTLEIKEALPAVGEAVEPIPSIEREDNGRRLHEERREELRARPGPEQEKLRKRPAERKEALEREEVRQPVQKDDRVDVRITPKKKPGVEVPPARLKEVMEKAQTLANQAGKTVYVKDGKVLIRKPEGEFTEIKPAPKLKPIKKPVVPFVKTKEAIQKERPTAVVTERTAQIEKDVDDVVNTDFTTFDPKTMTSARKEAVKEIRELSGLSMINSKTRRTFEDAARIASKKNVVRNARSIAESILEAPVEDMGDVKTAGLVQRWTEIRLDKKQAIKEMSQITDPALKQMRASEIERMTEEEDIISRAIDMSGSQAGRTLVAQKLTQSIEDFDIFSTINRAVAAKGSDLTSKRKGEYQKVVDELQKANTKIEKLAQEMQELKAKKYFKKGRAATEFKRMTKAQKDTELATLIAQTNKLIKEGCAR